MRNEPLQPAESTWQFIEELKAPLWTAQRWTRREPGLGEVSLAAGVTIQANFPDPGGVLETAYDDLRAFLQAGEVNLDGAFAIATRPFESSTDETILPETFAVEVTPAGCTISAGDTEGIRRGIFHIEDAMRSAEGPFLPLGTAKHEPVIRTRISRCFFGPIKRPPKNRDELADNVDYYPDNYLNRLAHDGVNALWLSIRFRDLYRSTLFPEHGADADRRLEKLRRTVHQCARYGIKIYVFAIEPEAFGKDPAHMIALEGAERHPELAGHRTSSFINFCTSSEQGQRYLEDSTYFLFNEVPGLGGLIDINMGERATHCYSSPSNFAANNCPRCSKRTPGEVFADTLSAMARGMHRANPASELVSWLYIPYLAASPELNAPAELEKVRHIAESVPPNVTLQVNFESLGRCEQHGHTHTVLDYSLAYVGPSEIFRDCAVAAREQGARTAAKLQVGCSHEVATVPFVPVPGNLYRKYRIMHELGVSTAMQCWYFGNYPSPMNKAAGLLGFAPLPETEAEFLHKLAAIDWGRDAPAVVAAWQHFRDAYGQFPAALQFSWYGPVHDSISWPLHLIPVDEIIVRSWQLDYPASGDRVAECFAPEFTFDQIQQTTRAMAEGWEAGLQHLLEIRPHYADNRERLLDIGVAEALALQLRSAANTMAFYARREELPHQEPETQLQSLAAMRRIAEAEIAASLRLKELALEDSRLGFHSEAEGYKYFPAKLQWRAEWLQGVLERDFTAVEAQIRNGAPLFPAYTGAQPAGETYRAALLEPTREPAEMLNWEQWSQALCAEITPPEAGKDAALWSTSWQAAADRDNLYLHIACAEPVETDREENLPNAENSSFYAREHVMISIEPRRLWPVQRFFVNRRGERFADNYSTLPIGPWHVEVEKNDGIWNAHITIPWRTLLDEERPVRPIRINVERRIPGVGKLGWIARRPLRPRNIFGDDNPADYGWVLFEK